MLDLITKTGHYLNGYYWNAKLTYENPDMNMSVLDVQWNYELSEMIEKVMNYMQNSLESRCKNMQPNEKKLLKMLNDYVDKMEKQVDLRNPDVPKQQGKKQLSPLEFDAKKGAISQLRELIKDGVYNG